MRLSCRLAPRQKLAQECSCCGHPDGHTPGCPIPRLEYWQQKRLSLVCPACQSNAVDLNTGDYYECRNCNTQYSAGDGDGEIAYLDPPTGDFIRVRKLPGRGKGEFRANQEIERLTKQVEEIAAANKS